VSSWSENWKTNDSETDHDGTVLNKQAVVYSHEESSVENVSAVTYQLIKFGVNLGLFPIRSIIKGNFFRMVDKVSVFCSVFSLQFLFDCCKLTERWGDETDNYT